MAFDFNNIGNEYSNMIAVIPSIVQKLCDLLTYGLQHDEYNQQHTIFTDNNSVIIKLVNNIDYKFIVNEDKEGLYLDIWTNYSTLNIHGAFSFILYPCFIYAIKKIDLPIKHLIYDGVIKSPSAVISLLNLNIDLARDLTNEFYRAKYIKIDSFYEEIAIDKDIAKKLPLTVIDDSEYEIPLKYYIRPSTIFYDKNTVKFLNKKYGGFTGSPQYIITKRPNAFFMQYKITEVI